MTYSIPVIKDYIVAYVDYRKALRIGLSDNAMRMLLSAQTYQFGCLTNEEQAVINAMLFLDGKDSPLLSIILNDTYINSMSDDELLCNLVK